VYRKPPIIAHGQAAAPDVDPAPGRRNGVGPGRRARAVRRGRPRVPLRHGSCGRRRRVAVQGVRDQHRLEQRLVAELFLVRIREAILAYRAERTREALLSAAWKAGLATAFVVLAFALLRFLFRALDRWIERRYAGRVKAVTIRSFELMRAERIWKILHGLIRAAGVLTLFAVIVIYLRYALALFPWTRSAAAQIDDWVLGPLAVLGAGFVDKIPNLIFLAVLSS
jgi:hypothetical protein